jgi:hypothetical protein
MNAHLTLIEAVAALLQPYADDEDLYQDMIEGETDALDLLDSQIASMQNDEALAEAIKAQEANLKARRERIEWRADAHKKAALLIMNAAGLKKAERPRATISVRPGSVSVQITDEAEIPTQLMREKITRAPDKAAIKAQLEAGETVPGAELVRGAETISVRVK